LDGNPGVIRISIITLEKVQGVSPENSIVSTENSIVTLEKVTPLLVVVKPISGPSHSSQLLVAVIV
jgi:hypothetical protein